jgi:penicillin amidase
MIFATTSGDIAIRQQGKFPAKWLRQGDFLMDGTSAAYDWQGYIEDSLNITMHNPERGFVSSANQYPYDIKTYPYYLGGGYALERGNYINKKLSAMQSMLAYYAIGITTIMQMKKVLLFFLLGSIV